MKKCCMLIAVVAIALFFVNGLKSADKRKVTVWSFAPNNVTEYKSRKSDVDARFDIDLDVQVIAENAFVQKLQAVMMDGKGIPDIIEWRIENSRILNADPKKCFVLPLNQYTDKSVVFKKVPAGRVAWVKFGKNVYGLPHDVHPVSLIYNDTLWKSVGVDMSKIETWDEFFEASKKLIAEKKDGKPVHYALPYGKTGLNDTGFMIWQQSGANILDSTGKPALNSPAFKAYAKKWMEWQKSGAFTMWDWGNFSALLANGTLASYASPDWWIPQVNLAATGSSEGAVSALGGKKTKRTEVKYQFRIRSLPAFVKGGPTSASWGGTFMAIPKGIKNPDLIYKIAEYLEYDTGSIKYRWKDTSMLPPFADVWSDPIFKQPDERFGGQILGEVLIGQAKKIPKVVTGDVFWDTVAEWGKQYTEIMEGKMSLDDGIKKAQSAAMEKYKEIVK